MPSEFGCDYIEVRTDEVSSVFGVPNARPHAAKTAQAD